MNRFVILVVALAAVSATTTSRSSSESIEVADDGEVVPYDEIVKHHDKYARSLTGNGIWTPWDVNRGTFPSQAVFSGHMNGPVFLIRAPFTDPTGAFIGTLVGKYMPLARQAFIGWKDRAYPVTNFEILLHENSAWAGLNDPRPLIPGPGRLICRALINGWMQLPGYVDGNLCLVPIWGKTFSVSGYQTLRRNCV